MSFFGEDHTHFNLYSVDSFLYLKENKEALSLEEARDVVKYGKKDILPIWLESEES